MLVIRRRAGEALLIGDEIEVEVLDTGSSQVKLGIRAPKHVIVLRKEIQIAGQENVEAAKEKSSALVDSLLERFKKREEPPIRAL